VPGGEVLAGGLLAAREEETGAEDGGQVAKDDRGVERMLEG
jgi:hypothetical protein